MIILNEAEYAERLLRDGLCGENPSAAIIILAKYFYHKKGLRRKEITASLSDFLYRYYPPYSVSEYQWREKIDKVISAAKKATLHEINGVSITQTEMDRIQELDDLKLERVIFVMLCLAKLNDLKNVTNNGWVNADTKEIFDMARVSVRMQDRFVILGKLEEKGMLEFPKKNGNLNNRVTFINNDSDGVLYVSDFRELGYCYLRYCGENITECAECGKLFPGNKQHNRRYCNDCSPRSHKKEKAVLCGDCGRQFFVLASNTQATRCPSCYVKYRRQQKTEWQSENRIPDSCGQTL